MIRYAYLWRSEQRLGQEEGVKDRPCAVVLASMSDEGDQIVTVLPVTHSPPRDPSHAVELPIATKKRLGLDGERAWIVVTEANRFVWPGPDLRFPPGGAPADVAYGVLPAALMVQVREVFRRALIARRAQLVARSE